ncbi:MAG: hypothetical protein ACKO1T_01440 [Sediminibacterium sp.]
MNLSLISGIFLFILSLSFSGCASNIDKKPNKDATDSSASVSYSHNLNPCKEIYIIDSFIKNGNPSGAAKRAYDYSECNKSWEVVESVYRRSNPFRNDSLNTQIFSTELIQLISQSKETEKLSRASILQSESPSDKPLLIEGEIFTSLYEGFTKINSGNLGYFYVTKAKLPFYFKNEYYHENWTDTMVLMYENNEWKFHDVIYMKQSPYTSLQERLKDFIRTGQKEQIQLKKQLKNKNSYK